MMNLLSMSSPRDPSPFHGLVAGVVGGLIGSAAMVAFQAVASRSAGSSLRPAEHDVAGDAANSSAEPSTVRGARLLTHLTLGADVPPRHRQNAGRAFHLAFGVGLGGAYGLLAEYARIATIASGVPFGTLQVVLADEWSVPALGLSEDPRQAPASSHLRALGGHLVYGVVTEQVRRRVRAWLGPAR